MVKLTNKHKVLPSYKPLIPNNCGKIFLLAYFLYICTIIPNNEWLLNGNDCRGNQT